MTSRLLRWWFLMLVSTVAAAVQPATTSLCHAPETTYFSCHTTRHKTLSVCGALPSALQYRYGSGAGVELGFPDDPASGPRQLLDAHYARYQVERDEVSFTRLDTGYTLFDYREGGQRSAGVRVTRADGGEVELRCAGVIRGGLALLRHGLRCDPDSALNGGACVQP